MHVLIIVGDELGEARRQLERRDDPREQALLVHRVDERAAYAQLAPHAPSLVDILREPSQAIVVDTVGAVEYKRPVNRLARARSMLGEAY